MTFKSDPNTSKSEIVLETSLQSFFYDQLLEINQKCASPLPHEAIYYSSLVMDHFGESGKYFELTDEGKVREKTLGVKLLEASNETRTTQRNMLKDVGDTALFLCGYFSDSMNRKIIDISYYQEIGQIAYQRLNHIVPEAYEVPSFFKKLSTKFSGVAELMNIVARNNLAHSEDAGVESYILFVANSSKIKAS